MQDNIDNTLESMSNSNNPELNESRAKIVLWLTLAKVLDNVSKKLIEQWSK